MEGADESTELWRHPILDVLQLVVFACHCDHILPNFFVNLLSIWQKIIPKHRSTTILSYSVDMGRL